MPDKYYYLTALLTYLKFNEPPPMEESAFLAECEKWLSPADLGAVSGTRLNETRINNGDLPLTREWKVFNEALRRDMALVREERKKGVYEKYPAHIKEIFEESNPLFMEIEVEKKRWNFLEEKATEHYFDVEALIIYFLKLKILMRLASFRKEQGKKVFAGLAEVSVE